MKLSSLNMKHEWVFLHEGKDYKRVKNELNAYWLVRADSEVSGEFEWKVCSTHKKAELETAFTEWEECHKKRLESER